MSLGAVSMTTGSSSRDPVHARQRDSFLQPCQAREERRKQPRKVMSLRSVQRLEQECDEIIACTGVNPKDSGIQYWGSGAIFLFVDGRRR